MSALIACANGRPWPILILRLEGGPDDGELRLWPAMTSVMPPERLVPSVEVPGEYLRQPELPAPWTWRYLWDSTDA
jgi:hypothetical protein